MLLCSTLSIDVNGSDDDKKPVAKFILERANWREKATSVHEKAHRTKTLRVFSVPSRVLVTFLCYNSFFRSVNLTLPKR